MRRNPTNEEKATIIKNHTKDGKIRCFIDDHPIDSDKEIEFHHIKPFSLGGDTDIGNLAPVCKDHHRRIGILSITEYRTKFEMDKFFNVSGVRKLNDVLELKLGTDNYGKLLKYEIVDSDKMIRIYFGDTETNITFPLYKCPATGYHYFYLKLPVKYLKNDDKLQPRPIEPKRLWELYVHLQKNTQLAPAICRLENNNIYLFDGQHKSAAQIWAGRDSVECKVYIEPDLRLIKETNLAAHDKLRQMQFFTSVLISKWADLFYEEWQEYLETKGEKSEKGFVKFLKNKGKSKIDAKNMIYSNIIDSVLDDDSNRIVEFVAERNRARKNPLAINKLKQTLFKNYIAPPPLEIDIEKSDELREYERKNMLSLLNIISEETLIDKWNPERNDAEYKKAERIFTSGSMKAWSKMLRDVVATVLRLYDEDERNKIFLRSISEDDFDLISSRIKRLFEHKLWADPSSEIDNNLRVNNEKHVKEFFESYGLTVVWILK